MNLENAKGTRDFLPEDKIAREQIVSTLKEVFELFGYPPLETPAIERFDVLSSKYTGGAEILKETFRFADQGQRDLGLRYDLTVPLARVIGQNPILKMPFKRYQIEKVWRDGPVGPGRYREFLQADADVIGIGNTNAEVEMIEIARTVFLRLRLDVKIKVNSRKILEAILDYAHVPKEIHDVVILAIDKLDKIGESGVRKELLSAVGLGSDECERLMEIISTSGKNEQKLLLLQQRLTSDLGKEGIADIETILSFFDSKDSNVIFDMTLARGLSYYTGCIFEAVPVNNKITSSVAGGGRYDDMIGLLLGNKRKYPAIGISFGIDRILDALGIEERPKTTAEVYVIPIKTFTQSLETARKLRKAGINADIDMQARGPSKNLDYANALSIPYVIFIGEQEIKDNKFKLRDMKSGKEEMLALNDIIAKIRAKDSK